MLEKLGKTDAADYLFREHYLEYAGLCAAYVAFLLRHDQSMVPVVLGDARTAFPEHEFEYIDRIAAGGRAALRFGN